MENGEQCSGVCVPQHVSHPTRRSGEGSVAGGTGLLSLVWTIWFCSLGKPPQSFSGVTLQMALGGCPLWGCSSLTANLILHRIRGLWIILELNNPRSFLATLGIISIIQFFKTLADILFTYIHETPWFVPRQGSY